MRNGRRALRQCVPVMRGRAAAQRDQQLPLGMALDAVHAATLVIDDHPLTAMGVSEFLKQFGLSEVHAVADAGEGLQCMAGRGFNVVHCAAGLP